MIKNDMCVIHSASVKTKCHEFHSPFLQFNLSRCFCLSTVFALRQQLKSAEFIIYKNNINNINNNPIYLHKYLISY